MAGRLSVRDPSRSPLALTATVMTAAVVVFLYWARVVVIPLALAIFFTFILSPAVTALRRRGVGRVVSVAVVTVAALVLLLGVGTFMTWQMAALVTELPNHSENIHAKLDAVNMWIGSTSNGPVAKLIAEIGGALKFGAAGNATDIEPVAVVIASSEDGWQRFMGVWLGPVAESLARIALTVLLTIFLLLGKEDMRNRVLRIIGPRRLTASTKAVDDAASRISRYLRMQLLINAGFGTAVAISLLALQIPYALLWGFIAGLMRYVPYIGAWMGLLPPLLASLAMTGSWWQPTLVLTSYALLEILINSLAKPRKHCRALAL